MCLLCMMLLAGNLFAQEEQEIIEHHGDRYIINVDALKPDKEMTLLDVLQTCPELLSEHGKRLKSDYELYIDNVTLPLDNETLLEALKASEISTIEVYMSTAVSTGGTGRGGTIDIYLKEQDEGKTSGKVLLEGSTRGNGKAYADVVTRTGDVTVRGCALTNLKFAKGSMTGYDRFSARQGIENVHLNVDWNISERDNLKVKLFQTFLDTKDRLFPTPDDEDEITELQRYWGAVASYTRTLNDRDASLLVEGGVDYLNTDLEDGKQRDCSAYLLTEAFIPLTSGLEMLAGWEMDYYNMWMPRVDRQQMMYNDLYLELDYAKGPWVLSLGDRLRIINYWHRTERTADSPLWKHNRTEHSYLASAGYKTGGHFVQGLFSHDYFTPLISHFYTGFDEGMQRGKYLSNILTNMVYNVEARYTYQQANLVASASVQHTWSDNALVVDEQYTGARASVTWRKGRLRLTAGADFFHGILSGPGYDIDKHDNFFHLRLLSTLLLNGGLRISSTLMYNSHQDLLIESPGHLYASVKVSKDLGRHLTLSADFHDLAGTPSTTSYVLGNYYDNRAVTIGLTYRY